jgi:hypothetical protein
MSKIGGYVCWFSSYWDEEVDRADLEEIVQRSVCSGFTCDQLWKEASIRRPDNFGNQRHQRAKGPG